MRRSREALLVALLVIAAASSAALAQVTTITFMHWGGNETYIQRHERLIAEFERLNPDVKVERIQGGNGPEYIEAVLTRTIGGVAPDVFMIDLQDVQFFADLTLDLTPYAEKDTAWDWSGIPAAAFEIMFIGGKFVGTLDSISPNIWFYNADMFNEAGLEYPTSMWQRGAWTWDDFLDVSRKLTRVDGNGATQVWGNAAGTGQALNRLFMWSNGAPEYDDPRKPTRSLYDTPEAIEAIRFVQQMQAEGISLPYPESTNGPFRRGQVAMMARWSSGIPTFGAQADFAFGTAPYPMGPAEGGRYASDLGASIFAVSRDSKNPEAAWRWVAFLGGPEAAQVWAEEGPGIPIRSGVSIGFLPENLIDGVDILFQLVSLPNDGNQLRLLSKDAAELNRIVDEGMAPIMRNEIPVETGMEEIARRANAFLEQNPQ